MIMTLTTKKLAKAFILLLLFYTSNSNLYVADFAGYTMIFKNKLLNVPHKCAPLLFYLVNRIFFPFIFFILIFLQVYCLIKPVFIFI